MTDLKWSRFNFLVETEKHRKYIRVAQLKEYSENPKKSKKLI